MRRKLTDGLMSIEVDSHGAELCSIRYDDREYLWQADPAYWNRHSPVLFPIVGRVWDNLYRVDGKEYSLPQHGFARDMEFTFERQTDNEIWFSLEDSPETLLKYPFRFRLEIGYRLQSPRIDVMWKVSGRGSEPMPFQIGAHPAFYFPDYNPATTERGFFRLEGKTSEPEYILVKEKGCVDADTRYRLPLTDGYLPLDTHTFDRDALIFDCSQIDRVTLCRQDKTPWLSLNFDAPLVGLWSPPGNDAPFVCIEPWYGRCDRAGFTGEYRDKDWMNTVAPGETFTTAYTIELK